MEIANPARAGPYKSSGIAYVFTLIANVKKKLMPMPSVTSYVESKNGIAAVNNNAAAAQKHTRNRAACTPIRPAIR